jgi:hypothetical protein
MKGLAIVLDANPTLREMVWLRVRYVKPRGLPEEQLPQQRLVQWTFLAGGAK